MDKNIEALEDPTIFFRTKRRLLERYTNTQLKMLGSLKPNIKQTPKSPITKGENPAHYPYVDSTHIKTSRQTKSTLPGNGEHHVTIKKRGVSQ
jgi:hypothetical protein